MNAKELRIGNIVELLIAGGGKFPNEIRPIKASEFFALSEHPNWASPIPLTEEWLLKFGFVRVDHIHGYSFYTLAKNKKNPCHLDIYKNKTVWMGYMIDQHCTYVHQLQNLYFALTGEELKIEES